MQSLLNFKSEIENSKNFHNNNWLSEVVSKTHGDLKRNSDLI